LKNRTKTNYRRIRASIAIGALAVAVGTAPKVFAGPQHGHGAGEELDNIRRVLLISIDGMHSVDYANCAKGLPGVNGGAPYCPNLAALGLTGINYPDSTTSKPSDSFPGLMAMITGGSPRTVGAFYDVAYDHSLQPPATTTGNGLAGGTCVPGQVPTGTTTEYEEGIDLDQTKLNGGAATGDGQINSIDPARLPRDPANNCNPVFPQNFVRTNTVFGVIHKAHRYTAWSDKHVAYITVSGPGDGSNIDDFYSPEINSTVTSALPQLTRAGLPNCNPIPDQNAVGVDDYTGSFQDVQCYDSLKAQAILNQIDGKTHDGSTRAPVPVIFGMNFQAVSVGEKLIYQDAPTVALGYSIKGGYLDSIGTPSPSLLKEIQFVDNAIGLMVAELKSRHLIDSTLIIISAKHGQSPIDSSRFLKVKTPNDPASILDAFLPASESQSGGQIGPTEDDVALLWLTDSTQTATAVALLQSMSPATNNIAGIGEIFWGPAIGLMYNLPGLPPNGDPRTPDIVITPNIGVVYTGSGKKLAEHGGFAHDDTNVMMLLSNPSLTPLAVTSPVQTSQIAPTILEALGLDPQDLQSVQKEHTQGLPGLDFN
jgi:Type I phosphodiesterase / nucleotide pyrophosphatase